MKSNRKQLKYRETTMLDYIKNYGVYVAEFIAMILLLALAYYGVMFFCLATDKCYNYYFGVL